MEVFGLDLEVGCIGIMERPLETLEVQPVSNNILSLAKNCKTQFLTGWVNNSFQLYPLIKNCHETIAVFATAVFSIQPDTTACHQLRNVLYELG